MEQTDHKPECGLYLHLGKFFLLFVLTLGFYQFYWIFRTTRALNADRSVPPRDPLCQLLLCMFVPFYTVLWRFLGTRRINRLAQEQALRFRAPLFFLVLGLMIPIVPAFRMQQKMNRIALYQNE